MRRTIMLVLVTALAVLGLAPTAAAGTTYVAPLSGDEEVPPVDTRAVGVAKFKLSDDGMTLEYKINVANLDDPFAAHIHCAPAGDAGVVGVTLFGTALSGVVSGTLVQGTITAPDPGNACGWEDLDDVIAAIEGGGAYVNVHTDQFPGGEIRGQIR